jgi:nucleoside-diphosphate-sugar epimerase
MFPSAPYAAAKWAASGYARMFHALYNVPVRIGRVSMGYGPGQKDLSKLIPYVTLSLLQGKSPKLGSGHRPVDWIYITDVMDGILALARASQIDGLTLDLGSGSLVSIREIVQQLSLLIDSKVNIEFSYLLD